MTVKLEAWEEFAIEALKEAMYPMGLLIGGSVNKATKLAYIRGLQRAVEIAKGVENTLPEDVSQVAAYAVKVAIVSEIQEMNDGQVE